ncbi:acyltransferase [Actinomycetospora cinnamomea]|uniref:Acetyltransferase-like isoleucine patch superfamily enzyme n=1 Tax=Actinomycetospora cinnamomea TaxID=663609 RepID=A0A2U1FR84_9PSEU|nr:acyltransferase [Actinomycetospora cinnamomea]PVZ14669.1 acetyltransferase-like isoleucine patch superfamily enzyme [Actinomycetospora cinnamomea]
MRSDPRQPRLVTWASLRWIVRHRAWTPFYLVRYWRMLKVRVRQPHIVLHGLVFLGRGVSLEAREGFGRLEIGRFVHIGDNTRVRCHEGSLRIGDKSVFGNENTINCYLDIEFGEATLLSDWIYVCDFDHRYADVNVPIKDQGIVKSPVRIGPETWIGTKVTVLRGARVGRGCVLGAHAVVRGDVPDWSVAVGAPARVVRDRMADWEAAAAQREALADIARKTALAAGRAVQEPEDEGAPGTSAGEPAQR